MHLLANTGNSLSMLVCIRSIKLISIYPYWYRIALDTDQMDIPIHAVGYINTRLRFISTTPIGTDTSATPLRIGVAVSDFKVYREAEDVYPRNCI